MEASLSQNRYLLKSKKWKNLMTKGKKKWLKERQNCKLKEMPCSRKRKKRGKSSSNKRNKVHQQTHIQTSDFRNSKKLTQKRKQSKLKSLSKRKRKTYKETRTTPLKKSHERRKEVKIWNLSLELHLLKSNQRNSMRKRIKVRSEKMCSARLNPRSLILIKLQHKF